MTHLKILSYFACLFCVLASGIASAEEPEPRKPNIIFIFADDWGYGDLGIHGSTFCKTPRIDQMAKEGTDFQNFTVDSPVCSPSRAAVMTGHFPARHSVHRHFHTTAHHVRSGMPDWLDPKAPMLPRMLQKAGYATAHFGKWHLSNDAITDAPLPTEYGYDTYGAFNLPSNAPEQMKTSATCPRAVEFIKQHRDQPFFINLWLHETHTPHYPLAEYLAKFESLEEQQQVYAAVVAEGDAGVGSILDTLKELDLDDNTLVIFSSDNGPENTGKADRKQNDDTSTGPGLGNYYSVGETAGLKGRKRSLFAGGIRVPFIARWPKVIPADRVDRQSTLTAVDLLPTFLELAQATAPENYVADGESIVAALKGESFTRTQPIFWEYVPPKFPHIGIRDGKWKLLLNAALNKAELYDIEQDWAEQTDRSKEHPQVVAAMKEKLIGWKESLPTNPPSHCFSQERQK